MTDFVYVEPADAHRRGFARWCLTQDPKIMTSSATGSDVPRDLFGDIPLELLDGAKVDGHIFRPVLDGYVPDGDGYAPAQAPADVVPVQDGPKPEAVQQTAAQPPSQPRARKRTTGSRSRSAKTAD